MGEQADKDQYEKDAKLAELALVRQSRLSVLPVKKAEWTLICKMGGTKP